MIKLNIEWVLPNLILWSRDECFVPVFSTRLLPSFTGFYLVLLGFSPRAPAAEVTPRGHRMQMRPRRSAAGSGISRHFCRWQRWQRCRFLVVAWQPIPIRINPFRQMNRTTVEIVADANQADIHKRIRRPKTKKWAND